MNIRDLINKGESTTLLLVTPEMLSEFARDVITEYKATIEEEPKFTPAEFAKRNGVNKSTLCRWRKMGILKPYMVGTKIYYRDSDLNEG